MLPKKYELHFLASISSLSTVHTFPIWVMNWKKFPQILLQQHHFCTEFATTHTHTSSLWLKLQMFQPIKSAYKLSARVKNQNVSIIHNLDSSKNCKDPKMRFFFQGVKNFFIYQCWCCTFFHFLKSLQKAKTWS